MRGSCSEPNDGAIINAVLDGDKERFAILVERYQAALVRLAHSRLGRGDWAEEVVQESFLCAFRFLPSYDSRFSFRTWLWTIVLNQCRRCYQRNQRVPRVKSWTDQCNDESGSSELSHLESPEATPDALYLASERSQVLARLLRQLPDAQADALRLRFFGELKFQEIADTMGCSLSTAKNRVKWGLSKLSQLICDRADADAASNAARCTTEDGQHDFPI